MLPMKSSTKRLQMKTLKISPSLLDQYRSVCAGEYNKGTADLVAYITDKFVPNIHTSRGSAYHEMIEHGPDKYMHMEPVQGDIWENQGGILATDVTYQVYEKELGKTWTFSAAAVKPIFDLRASFPDMLHEVWHTHWMESHGHPIRIRMKYDGLDGLIAHESKTTGSSKKREDYFKTVQWKMYLLANPELIQIQYHIFQLNTNNTKCTPKEFTFRPYPQLEAEVQDLLDGLVGWLKTQPKLMKYLEALEDRSPWAKA